MESLKDNPDWECFIFHDVDLMPEDDRNLYTCPVLQPRHMSVAVDTMNYTLMYRLLMWKKRIVFQNTCNINAIC